VSREINGFHHHPIDANCKLCIELVAEKILEILGYCKVGNTHLGNSSFPNQNQDEFFHSCILTSLCGCHFQTKPSQLNICQQELTIGFAHWLL
jgi:hypothetical protein